MKIYTKKGDQGTTQLIGGKRVSKDSIKIEAYGTVDELNSYVGLIRDQLSQKSEIDELLEIQDRLFTIGSILASTSDSKMKLPEIEEMDVTRLEQWMDQMDEVLAPMTNFVLPGGHTTVSFTHIARCVCRRAERIVVELSHQEKINPLILVYLNRLSDYLFVLSRKLTMDLNAQEIAWKPRI